MTDIIIALLPTFATAAITACIVCICLLYTSARVDEYATHYVMAWEIFEWDSDGPEPLNFAEWLAALNKVVRG